MLQTSCEPPETIGFDAVKEAGSQAKGALERQPNAQNLIAVASEEAQLLHELTHTPYAPWCSSRIAYRARAMFKARRVLGSCSSEEQESDQLDCT